MSKRVEPGTSDLEPGAGGLLAVAIERQEWEVAALCLLLGLSRAVRSLPPGAAEALLEVLDEGPVRGPSRAGRRRGGCRGRRC